MRLIPAAVFTASVLAMAGPAARAAPAPAPPQTRSPWADSTYITGVAERVMPLPAASGGDPSTIQELLDKMDGAQLYFRPFVDARKGGNELPAWWRVVMGSAGARVEEFMGSWQLRCTLGPLKPSCAAASTGSPPTRMVHEINANGITIHNASCVYDYPRGYPHAEALYTWGHYVQGVGKFSNVNRLLQPWSNGYSGYWFQGASYGTDCPAVYTPLDPAG